MKLKKYLLIFLCIIACQPEKTNDRTLFARVGDDYLYEEDIQHLFQHSGFKTDSSELLERYIDSWVRERTFLQYATQHTKINEEELKRKLDVYKSALIEHEFKKHYLDENLNKDISEEEIKSYYNKNKEEFELKQNIVRALLVKIPVNAPNKHNLKNWMISRQEKDLEKIKKYCMNYAISYNLDDTTWVDFDQVTIGTPLRMIPDKINLLRQQHFIESQDSSYVYYFKIRQYKIANQTSPINFVRDQITEMIINERRNALIKRLETQIFNEAKRKKLIEIYTKKK